VISVEDALERILANLPVMPPEQIGLTDALGRVLAEDVAARLTQPPLAVSAMDGYAVRAADVASVPATLRIVAEVPAGRYVEREIGPGETARIFTGAPLPPGTDAIVIQEDTTRDGDAVTVTESCESGNYVRPAGLDFRAGEVLLEAGRVLSARDIGLAAAMNVPWLRVRRQPRVAILATGDEIVLPGEATGPTRIVSSNSFALDGLIRISGGIPVSLGIAADNEDSLRRLAEAAHGVEFLVTTGGASVGDHDLVQSVLGRVGLSVDFWQIAMRPGKPLMFGRFGDVPMLGMPGNPVSSMVCAILFLRPALTAMLGVSDRERRRDFALLGCAVEENDRRQDYMRATLSWDADGNRIATPFARQDSSMFSRLAMADCLVVRPPHAPAADAGSRVEIVPLGGSLAGI
jgi:molybdopterin molybdotransferase